jgi:hypothetical protein
VDVVNNPMPPAWGWCLWHAPPADGEKEVPHPRQTHFQPADDAYETVVQGCRLKMSAHADIRFRFQVLSLKQMQKRSKKTSGSLNSAMAGKGSFLTLKT